jgi:hypothetical protein
MKENTKKYKTVYKKFATYVPLDEMHGIQWFALRGDYGTSYGDIRKKYRFKKAPRLLDIGDAEVRSRIVDTISPMDPRIVGLSDPDEQYSGGAGNRKYHELVKKYFGDSYDGTVIDEKHLVGNDRYSVEDLEGPSEMVLWDQHSELLSLVSDTPKNPRYKTKKKLDKKSKKGGKRRSSRNR